MTLTTGAAIPFIQLPLITQAHLNQYADASGDHNGIHLDEKIALSMGLRGVIAHGMLSAGFLGERAMHAVRNEAGRNDLRIARFQSRFKSMVHLGDQISVGGTVKDASDQKVTLELIAKNQKEETVTVATVEFERSSPLR